MNYLKRFGSLNESIGGMRKEGADLFIDGINEEGHFLYPVVEMLNDCLQMRNSNKEQIIDKLDNAWRLCRTIFLEFVNAWDVSVDEARYTQCNSLYNFITSLIEESDNGMDLVNINKIIHDIVVNCKLSYSYFNLEDGDIFDW